MNITSTKSPNFRAGLTMDLVKTFKQINVPKIENNFGKMGVNANFYGSKTFSGCNFLVGEILDTISKRYNLPLGALPDSIRVFKTKELNCDEASDLFGFCSVCDDECIKNEPQTKGISLFFNKQPVDSIILRSIMTTFAFVNGNCSSPHFLANIMHEWFHNIHADLIYKRFGCEEASDLLKKKYPVENPSGYAKIVDMDNHLFTFLEEDFISEFLGDYAIRCQSLLELFAEFMTKITTQSLNKNLNVTKNPLDNIPQNTPKSIKNFIEETLNI